MLIKCDNSSVQKAAEYIGAERVTCFYLYMDMMEYGAEKDGVALWLCEDENGINTVMYRYFDTLHIYSRGLCSKDEVLQVIAELNPKCITGKQENIDLLLQSLDADRYTYELSHIITAEKMMEGNSDLSVQPAGEADVPEIAALMMKEEIYYTVYTYERLCEETMRRVRDGFGRLFVMRDETGRLVATNATSAETEDLAVISGLVTDPDCRGRGLGRAITASTWNLVKTEGKQGLAFLGAENEKTLALHRKMGYTFIGMQARLLVKG